MRRKRSQSNIILQNSIHHQKKKLKATIQIKYSEKLANSQTNKKMKQKILIRVSMTDDTTRAKAMSKAVKFKGVSGVEIKGDHRNQIEVTGDEVDMIPLVKKIRKKVAFAELVSVTKVEPPKKEPGNKGGGDKKGEGDKKGGDAKKGEGDKKGGDDKKGGGEKTGGDGKKGEGDKKPPEPKPVPLCYPCPPVQGYGVPSAFPYPCHPYGYIGEPVYDHEPKCTIM